MPVRFEISSLKKLTKKSQTIFDTLSLDLLSNPDAKSVAITSNFQKEGKSYVALQLASSMSKLGMKIVYLDLNLSTSSLKKQYGIKSDGVYSGIDEFLSGKVALGSIIGSTNLPNVSMILTSQRIEARFPAIDRNKIRSTIDALATVFDYIIIDTASISDSVDALSVASSCDGTLLVVQEGRTTIDELDIAVRRIKKSGGSIFASVLNQH